jgi:FkbM family methyltransferase
VASRRKDSALISKILNSNQTQAALDALRNPELFYYRLARGPMDTNLYAPLKALKKKGVNFRQLIDVGANCGRFSLAFSLLWPEADIVAFEPLAALSPVYARNLRRHKGNVRFVALALGDAPGAGMLNVTRDCGASSLLEPDALPDIVVRKDTVQIDRLDNQLNHQDILGHQPALLKLDVQGSEAAVLRGATAVLDAVSYVILECLVGRFYQNQSCLEDIVSSLKGFEFRGVVHTVYDTHRLPSAHDLLFKNARQKEL